MSKMDTRQVVKFCIYCTLVGTFIYLIFEACFNWYEEKIVQSTINRPIWNMNMTMPSMTICPLSGDFSDNPIKAKDILETWDDFLPFNITATYEGNR